MCTSAFILPRQARVGGTAKQSAFSDGTVFNELRKDVTPAFTPPRYPCLLTRQKTRRSVTPRLLKTIRKHVHLCIHTASRNLCLVTRQKSQRLVKLYRLVTLKRGVHPGRHTATTSTFLVTRRKSQRSVTAALSHAWKTRSLRHSHRHAKSVLSDTFSGVISFSNNKKRHAPWHSHSYDKSVFDSQRLVTFQHLVTFMKDGHPGIYTAMASPYLVTWRKGQHSVTLQH